MIADAFAQNVSIETLCRALADHTPDAGVEYVPGAEDVVPADLGRTLQALPRSVIKIPITLELVERFPALNIPSELELEPNVGNVSIHLDGRVEYNGQDITARAHSVCNPKRKPALLNAVKVTEPVVTDIAPVRGQANGQMGADVLKLPSNNDAQDEVLGGQYP